MNDLIETAKANLQARGYRVRAFETADEAKAAIVAEVRGTTVSFGGSVTLREMGLFEALSANNTLLWHWAPNGNGNATLADAATTEVFFSSVNGLAATGEIINIDGTCNRISGTVFGHKKVYLVVGVNKLAPDFDSALWRARNIAAPLNAKRLGRKTPCAVNADRCYDCNSPERICRAMTVLWRAPSSASYEIILINQPLGY